MGGFDNLMQGRNWEMLLRGIIAILLGIFALVNTSATAMVLVIWLGLYAIVDGLLKIYSTIFQRGETESFWRVC